MIARLSGKLIENALTEIVLDVQGVGYALQVPLSTAEKLPPPGGAVVLLTHLQVREDSLQLFGFLTAAERDLFRLLLNSVTGIGSKLALNVLSSMSIAMFCAAITGNDLKLLGKINGVGKKTAERMVIELREKLAPFMAGQPPADGVGAPGAAGGLSAEAADAVAALETLGYKADAATRIVRKLCQEAGAEGALPASTLIRKALSQLNA